VISRITDSVKPWVRRAVRGRGARSSMGAFGLLLAASFALRPLLAAGGARDGAVWLGGPCGRGGGRSGFALPLSLRLAFFPAVLGLRAGQQREADDVVHAVHELERDPLPHFL